MEKFLAFFLVHWAVLIVWYKYNMTKRLEDYSNEKENKFLYELSTCEFCVEHHLAVPLMGVLFLIFEPDWVYLIYPLMSSALSNILKSGKV